MFDMAQTFALGCAGCLMLVIIGSLVMAAWEAWRETRYGGLASFVAAVAAFLLGTYAVGLAMRALFF